MKLLVIVQEKLISRISDIRNASEATGIGGVVGNKVCV